MALLRISTKVFCRRESGVALLEAVVALAILGIVAVTFLVGLSSISKADFIISKQSDAESAATSQLEYIKSQSYISYAVPGHGNYDVINVYSPYTIEVTTVPINPATGQPLASGQDNGVQRITVSVKYQGEQAIALQSYKVNR